MPDVPVFLYDSFAARRFGGNVAGVVLLERPADTGWMQGIAAELGAPTTGFVDMLTARQHHARVRFFTPRQEIGACGHVTVAIATALAETGVWPPGEAAVSAPGGHIPLSVTPGATGEITVELRQRLQHLEHLAETAGLDGVLGPVQQSQQLPLTLAGTALRHLLVPARHAGELAALPLTAAGIAAVSQALKADTIGVYAIAAEDSEMVSVRMRDLCAGIGATEEPASGTTAATLAFVLANAGLLTSSRPRLQVDMGMEMGRPSRLMVDLDFTGGKPTLARLRGSADRVLAGQISRGAGDHRRVAPSRPAGCHREHHNQPGRPEGNPPHEP